MTRYTIIVWSAMLAACGVIGGKPPVVTPEPPAATVYTLAAIVADQYGTPIEGATITLSPEAGAYQPTNRDGYTAREVAAGTYTVTASTACCGTAAAPVTLDRNHDARLTVTRPRPPYPTDGELHLVRASFCNLRDAQGRVIFTAFYAGLPEADRRDWLTRLVADGSTHVVLSPAAGYPNSPIPAFDMRDQPARFAAVVREVMATPGANGKALTPILMLDDGAPGIRDRVSGQWPAIRAALGDDVAHVLVVPGWELIKASDATSADYSFALEALNAQGWPHIWAHLSPGRASASSNPIEVDDPWQGAEADMWKSNGGQYVEGLLYQSEAIRPGDERCDPTQEDCWLNRWEDIVVRIPYGGPNINGWRPMHLAYFEGPAYFYYRGGVPDDFPVAAARAALAMCQRYGAVCGVGNGGPALLAGIR